MDDEIEQAFFAGMRKRAMEKQAFVGTLAGGIVRGMLPFAMTGKVLSGMQSRFLPKLMKKPGLLGTAATKLNNGLNNPIGNSAAHMGLHSVLSPVIDPAVGYVANKFDGQGY
jgi:hypothetical protein